MVKVVPSVGAHNLILDQPDDRLYSSELNHSAYDQTSLALTLGVLDRQQLLVPTKWCFIPNGLAYFVGLP